MSQLSVVIANLKKGRSTEEIIKSVGVSRETFRRLERGDTVKLSTIKEIAAAMGARRSEMNEVLAAWTKRELGEDAKYLVIEPRNHDGKLHAAAENQCAQMLTAFEELSYEDRVQILLAAKRREIRRALPALNSLWSDLHDLAASNQPAPQPAVSTKPPRSPG